MMLCHIVIFVLVGVASASTHRKVMIRTSKPMSNPGMSKAVSSDPQMMTTMSPMNDQMKDQSMGAMGDDFNPGGKGEYYMYANSDKHQYDFGYKRGNQHHQIERSEKAMPQQGHFKTKVRWGDKDGGYGEQYWDYNHAGHEKGNSGEMMDSMQDGEGEESSPQPQKEQGMMEMGAGSSTGHDYFFASHPPKNHRMNRQASTLKPMPETVERVKRHHKKIQLPKLVFDTATWTVIDENTDQHFYLHPIVS